MDKKTKIAIVCAEANVLSAAIQNQLGKYGQQGIEIVTPEQAMERGITFNEPEPIVFTAPAKLEYPTEFNRPLTRRERRALKRKNNG